MQKELGTDVIPQFVNFDELLDSSEPQYSHLSHGNNNTHLVISPHREGSPPSLLLNHIKVMILTHELK